MPLLTIIPGPEDSIFLLFAIFSLCFSLGTVGAILVFLAKARELGAKIAREGFELGHIATLRTQQSASRVDLDPLPGEDTTKRQKPPEMSPYEAHRHAVDQSITAGDSPVVAESWTST